MTARRPIVLWGVSGAAVGLLYLPLVILCLLSFNEARWSIRWQGWTLRWYAQLAADGPLWTSLWVSVQVALWSTLLATVVGVGAALALEPRGESARSVRRLAQVAEGTLLLPLVMPELILGVAFMLGFVLLQLPLGLSTVTLAHAAFNAPLVWVLVRARLRQLDPALSEAAADLGATPWQAFRRVTLPLLQPAIAGAALLAFAVSFDDFLVTFFTAGPGSTTLPLRIYSQIRTGVTPELNALSTVLLALSIGLVSVALWLQRRRLS